jgi:CheY-like chemotaxis protein
MQQQDLTAIYTSGQHLLMLINDILDLSKIEAGKMELAFSDLNLADLINSAMSTATGLVKDKPIKLIANFSKDLPLVRADATRVRQVVINFLSNAAKFTEQGSITITAEQAKDPAGKPEIIVTVTDTGPGIAETDRSKLFLPFSQVDDSATRKTGGTGLGLSICRSLIELHGGRIGLLRSKIGEGSTFFFSLPQLVKEDVAPITRPVDGTNLILSIDDDPQVIGLYQRYLKPQGYTVIAHTDPQTAVSAARDLRPMAITLDIMMPDHDGWQVLQDLKNDPLTRGIPIIVCSILEDEEKGFSLGAADYLVKPFLQDDLITTLSRIIPGGKMRHILVIDDDPDDLRLVQKMLAGDRNLQITLVQGGKMGWDILSQSISPTAGKPSSVPPPDAIILDLLMPDLDGFSLMANLRMDPVLREIPVIILTGADLTAEQHQTLQDFGRQMLSKNYLREKDLLITLENSLRRLRPAPAPSF